MREAAFLPGAATMGRIERHVWSPGNAFASAENVETKITVVRRYELEVLIRRTGECICARTGDLPAALCLSDEFNAPPQTIK